VNDNLSCTSRLARQWGQAIVNQRRAVAEITGQPFTQQMLANAVGVTRQAVSQWESGEQLPAHCHIPKIARALHTTPAVLFPYEAAA
jgi:transcriptional regulator with XRE-family HTH domain